MYAVVLEPSAQRDLRRLPMTIVNRVVTELRRLEADPRHRGVKKLVGFDQWRARVGEYRILYEVDDDGGIVHIYSVVHRGSAYR